MSEDGIEPQTVRLGRRIRSDAEKRLSEDKKWFGAFDPAYQCRGRSCRLPLPQLPHQQGNRRVPC